MAHNDIGIDLGTTSIIIYIEGKGIVLNEPTVVAVNTETNEVLAVGQEAYLMIGRTPAHIQAIRPLKDGVISDHLLTKELVKNFLLKVCKSHSMKPRVAVCVPANINGIESDAATEAVLAAGAGKVYLIDEPIAAAIGSDIDVLSPQGNLIVDIGGGTSDIAVIALGGKVHFASIKTAGNKLDTEIVRHIRLKYHIVIGEKSAEKLKFEIGSASRKQEYYREVEIKGRSLDTGMPCRQLISTFDLLEPIEMCMFELAEAIHSVLEKTPPELAGDIHTNGITLTGGGALLTGICDYLSQVLKVSVFISKDPINCVAIGTGKSIKMSNLLETGFKNVTPKIGR